MNPDRKILLIHKPFSVVFSHDMRHITKPIAQHAKTRVQIDKHNFFHPAESVKTFLFFSTLNISLSDLRVIFSSKVC